MNLYKKHILPRQFILGCNKKPQMIQRAKIVPFPKGNVLEIGIGSGLNLSFYDKKKVTNLVGIDPAIELWNKRELLKNNLGFQFIVASAEDLPFENNTFDTVLLTYTL